MHSSDYNIYVPLPNADEYLLIHGYSGAVAAARKPVVDFLRHQTEEVALENAPIAEQTLQALIKGGFLTHKTSEQESQFALKLGQALHSIYSKAAGFVMMPTYDCNLRCTYCFERSIQNKERNWLQKRMDRPTVDAAFRAMAQLHDGHHEPSILFYGGEPLLRSNLPIIEYIIERGIAEGFESFSAITNGVNLEAYLPLLGKDKGKIQFLQITLDGPAAVHDRRRGTVGGGGSFEPITRNIALALETQVMISVRINVDADNLESLRELDEFFVARSWPEKQNFQMDVNPVTVDGECGAPQISQFELNQAVQRMGLQAISTGVKMGHKFLQLWQTGTYPQLAPGYCSSNYGQFLFDALGDIYPCWEYVGTGDRIGRFVPELEIDESKLAQWRQRVVANIPECQRCKYALLCGGGCSSRALSNKGTLYRGFCDDFEAQLLQQVPLAYAEYVKTKALPA